MTARQKVLVGIGALIVLVNTVMIAERIINPATASLFATGQHNHPYAAENHSHYGGDHDHDWQGGAHEHY